MKLVVSTIVVASFLIACNQSPQNTSTSIPKTDTIDFILPDTNHISHDEYGELVRYGRALMLKTAELIGPNGSVGGYTGNLMNCTNCHQWAGAKPYSFNLIKSHLRYPQYRAREGKVLTLPERINNCVTRPHSGKPLPYESKEMTALLCYLKWLSDEVPKDGFMRGERNLSLKFPARAANPQQGKLIYESRCLRCHNSNGEGILTATGKTYQYPPLWGATSYQAGSSMHRVIKQAQWLKANMPFDSASWDKPVLTDEEALDVAAFVNDDSIHFRSSPKNFDYPVAKHKAIDYGKGPFADTFSAEQHKFGPYQPIIDYWKKAGLKPTY